MRIPLALSILVVPSAAQLSGGGPGAGAELANLDVVIRDVASNVRETRTDGRWVLYEHEEAGVDRNGDGDTTDFVYALHDLVSGATTELGLAGEEVLAMHEGRALIAVDEVRQGGTDLDGNGFALGNVCFGVDLATATVTNSGTACDGSRLSACFAGSCAVFRVPEGLEGDLDGDGDVGGYVPVVWESFAATPVVIPLAVEQPLVSHQSFVLFGADEDHAGDRNGDGDDDDWVLHAVDLDDPSLTLANTGLAVLGIQAVGPRSAFLVPESMQEADLNGDGDELDQVLHVFDAEIPQLTNTGFAVAARTIPFGDLHVSVGTAVALSEDALAFAVSEHAQGATDLNGDGVLAGCVLFVRAFATGVTSNLGLACFQFALGEGVLACEVREADQHADLDGDGVVQGHVAHLHEIASGATTNLALATAAQTAVEMPFAFSGKWLALSAMEGGADENGDGDGDDAIVHLVDLDTGVAESQHLSTLRHGLIGAQSRSYLTFSPDGRLSFLVEEAAEQRDLNADGDIADAVPHYLLPSTGALVGSTLSAEQFPHLDAGFARRHPVETFGRELKVVRLRR